MGKIALGEVMNGRNDKGASWHWANRQRVNWQKGKMVSGQKDDWARWQRGKMVKGEMGKGRDGIGRNGKKSWAKWEWANGIGQTGKTSIVSYILPGWLSGERVGLMTWWL